MSNDPGARPSVSSGEGGAPTFPSSLGPLDLDTVIAGSLRYAESLQADDPEAIYDPRDPDTVAHEALNCAIRSGPAAAAWHLIRELLRRTPDDRLGVQAAGPLEELVRRRGAEIVEMIEAEVARDPRFRAALGSIWLSRGELPDPVLERVVRASGGEIRPLPPLE
ncbi:MAG TPA: hypothetical protein VGX50_06110, partial [Longimicrobium sp.]|nr:hypothetical protein [Longimicrobium sp.]